jgi:hypothetical protein
MAMARGSRVLAIFGWINGLWSFERFENREARALQTRGLGRN